MDRGSPICRKLRLQMMQHFLNNVHQCKIVMTISLFKVHNISSEDQNLEKCNNAAFNIGSLNIWNGNVDA